MTPEIFLTTSKQVKDHLLCRDCESILAEAEAYAIPLLSEAENHTFPLLSLLREIKATGNGRVSATMAGVDVDKLAYFALSIFWRASVKTWVHLNGQKISVAMNEHEEPTRKFLRRESGLPPGFVLKIAICTDAQSQGFVFAPVQWTNDLYRGYETFLLGVNFTLVVGVPPGAKDWNLCATKTNDVFLEDCSETTRGHYRDLRRNARLAFNAAKRP
jgi:hypothetical protein